MNVDVVMQRRRTERAEAIGNIEVEYAKAAKERIEAERQRTLRQEQHETEIWNTYSYAHYSIVSPTFRIISIQTGQNQIFRPQPYLGFFFLDKKEYCFRGSPQM